MTPGSGQIRHHNVQQPHLLIPITGKKFLNAIKKDNSHGIDMLIQSEAYFQTE